MGAAREVEMAPLVVLDPTSVVRPRVIEGQLAARLPDFRGQVVGLIDDGLLGSEYYTRGLEDLLRAEYPGVQTHFWAKPILSRPAPPEMIAEAAERCDAVIVGSAG